MKSLYNDQLRDLLLGAYNLGKSHGVDETVSSEKGLSDNSAANEAERDSHINDVVASV